MLSIIAQHAINSDLDMPSSGLCPSDAISSGPMTTVLNPSSAKKPASVPKDTLVADAPSANSQASVTALFAGSVFRRGYALIWFTVIGLAFGNELLTRFAMPSISDSS